MSRDALLLTTKQRCNTANPKQTETLSSYCRRIPELYPDVRQLSVYGDPGLRAPRADLHAHRSGRTIWGDYIFRKEGWGEGKVL